MLTELFGGRGGGLISTTTHHLYVYIKLNFSITTEATNQRKNDAQMHSPNKKIKQCTTADGNRRFLKQRMTKIGRERKGRNEAVTGAKFSQTQSHLLFFPFFHLFIVYFQQWICLEPASQPAAISNNFFSG